MSSDCIQIDVVILSYAKSEEHREMTQCCLDSLHKSNDKTVVEFIVTVIESNGSLRPFSYRGASTIYPDQKFGYNRYLNIGIKKGVAPFICLCNNDLIFHPGWANAILDAFQTDSKLMSASPACPVFHPAKNIELNRGTLYGYTVQTRVAGWCIFARRSVFDQIGLLDEKFTFWYCDNDYAKLLEEKNLLHGLVTSSLVTHLQQATTKTFTYKKWFSLTQLQECYFKYKWEHKSKPLFWLCKFFTWSKFYFYRVLNQQWIKAFRKYVGA